MSILTINRLIFKASREEIEQLKQYDDNGSWLLQPFTYRLSYDGYFKDSFTSSLGGCQEDFVERELCSLSEAFPNIRFILSQYRDYPDAPLDIYMTSVFEGGRSYSVGYGSVEEFFDKDTLFCKFGLDLNLDAEEAAKKITFDNGLFNGDIKPAFYPYKRDASFEQENMLPDIRD